MISRNEVEGRKYEVMKKAAQRWKEHAPEVAATAELLAQRGALAAASPTQRERYVTREAAKVAVRYRGTGWERMIGATLDFDDLPPTASAFEAGKPIGRIVELIDTRRVGEGFATGFLVSGGLLVTNWHVFGRAGEAQGCGVQFGFQRNESGVIDSGTVFELDPAQFFHSDEELDIALVGIKRTPELGSQSLDFYKTVCLIPTVGKILAGQPISIIQHPHGGHKRWAVRENTMVREPSATDLFLEYTTDTLPGSSGSPAFNKDWELVAVHHSGVPRTQGDDIVLKSGGMWRAGVPDSDIDWVANEGARVSKIHAHLQALRLQDSAQQQLLAALLANSTDPVATGGMRVGALEFQPPVPGMSASQVSAAPAVNVVVNGTANFFLGRDGVPTVVENPQVIAPPLPSRPLISSALEKKLKFDADYPNRPGYQNNFLPGFTIPVPKAPLDEVIKHEDGQKVLRYHHYSLAMHKERRFCIWAASNVNYSTNKRWRTRKEFGSDTWKPDPRVLGENQIDDVELYDPAKKFDQGHIVRRDDVAWGDTQEEEEFGNSDSFHFTNCTPQHEEFNRASFQFQGLWGDLENHVATQAGFLRDMVTVFAGPVLADNDPIRDFGLGAGIQIPIEFWKVVVAVEDADTDPTLRAYGFILSQQDAIDKHGWENRFRAGKFKEQQVSLSRITEKARVTFPQVVLDADPLKNDSNEARGRTLRTLADVRLR